MVAEDRTNVLKKPRMLVRFCAELVMPAPESRCDLRHALYSEDQECAIPRTLQFVSRRYTHERVGLTQHGFTPPMPGGHQDQDQRQSQG
jgi:hypothetical protein